MFEWEQILRMPKVREFLTDGTGLHLAVFAEPCLSRVYSGEKTVESRFMKNRIAPYDRVQEGDLVLIKRSSGPVEALFRVGEVRQFALETQPIEEIRRLYGDRLCVEEAFWETKRNSRYAVLMEIEELVHFKPFWIEKRGMQGWISR